MAISRGRALDDQFRGSVAGLEPAPARSDLNAPVRRGSILTGGLALLLFEAQVESRLLDLIARELKARNESFYTIGSSGHEGNAAVAAALGPDDTAFLHYRSGAFYCARALLSPGPEGPLDVLLGMVASSDEPIAGGRHKVFGSVPLNIPPQTSTIASHLPKALGHAVAMDRRARLDGSRPSPITVCTFGDASANHASATTAFNAAAWASFQRVPAPVLFVCEDNGLGISVRTPSGWIAAAHQNRPGVAYFFGDGTDLVSSYEAATAAVAHVRSTRSPGFLHLSTVRLLGHAGSDVEQLYRDRAEIEATEARDPLLRTAELLVGEGWLTPAAVLALYEDTRSRLEAMAEQAIQRPKLVSREEVMCPLAPFDAPVVEAEARVSATDEARRSHHGGTLPEHETRHRHLAWQLRRVIGDQLLARPEAVLFGEDVAKKGGVYHVTAGLSAAFGVGRVFNTLLDETTILGLAIGCGHAGLLPLPEVQYLAYLMNAIDQLRGEAGSMQFFSNGAYRNPMVLRIASLAYQKGFGGHFHNDHGVAALREIPGLIIGCPARGDDAVRMYRTMVGAAAALGRVTVFLEPIALYMTKDLHETGDGGWLTPYPAPDDVMPLGELGVYDHGSSPSVAVVTYGNGLWMSQRVAERRSESVRVIDLRWLQPLPHDAIAAALEGVGRVLIVDECRASSGIAAEIAASLAEACPRRVVRRLTAPDTYIPLGAAANLVLVQEEDIDGALTTLMEVS
jgi:2-oxoisovalerate dehydrogenase E1 component